MSFWVRLQVIPVYPKSTGIRLGAWDQEGQHSRRGDFVPCFLGPRGGAIFSDSGRVRVVNASLVSAQYWLELEPPQVRRQCGARIVISSFGCGSK